MNVQIDITIYQKNMILNQLRACVSQILFRHGFFIHVLLHRLYISHTLLKQKIFFSKNLHAASFSGLIIYIH